MHRGLYATDAGMHCVWDRAAFAGVSDYDSWERELLDDADIARHIVAGHFVPLNIGSDGGMEIALRVGSRETPAELSDREQKYRIVSSEPYRLHSTGSIGVSGIEAVAGGDSDDIGSVPLDAGDYAATVHLIAWDEEPGMQTADGPAAGALPDYLVLINPADSTTGFRTSLTTFER